MPGEPAPCGWALYYENKSLSPTRNSCYRLDCSRADRNEFPRAHFTQGKKRVRMPLSLPCKLAFLFVIVVAESILALSPCIAQSDQPANTQRLEIPFTPPEQALSMLSLPDGFKATLFASEPDVQQPIAVATDHRGTTVGSRMPDLFRPPNELRHVA